MVHLPKAFVHGIPQRMEAFEKNVKKHNEHSINPGLLPLKDVVTRWDSKGVAIARKPEPRETIAAPTTRWAGHKTCSRSKKELLRL
jgi:hypothetical protein